MVSKRLSKKFRYTLSKKGNPATRAEDVADRIIGMKRGKIDPDPYY